MANPEQKRKAKRGPQVVREWVVLLTRMTKVKHLRVHDDDLYLLAGLLALVGTPKDVEARGAYHVLIGLFFDKSRVQYCRKTLQGFAASRETVLRLVHCVRAWENVTGRTLGQQKFKLHQTVEVMLEIPAPDEYVAHLYAKDFIAFGAIYHPNTLNRAKRELRGLFSGTGGQDGYWETTKDELDILTDD